MKTVEDKGYYNGTFGDMYVFDTTKGESKRLFGLSQRIDSGNKECTLDYLNIRYGETIIIIDSEYSVCDCNTRAHRKEVLILEYEGTLYDRKSLFPIYS